MSRAEYISRLGNESNLFVATNNNVGVGSTIPTDKFQVSGTVVATSFVGSGSSLTNLNIPESFTWIDASLF